MVLLLSSFPTLQPEKTLHLVREESAGEMSRSDLLGHQAERMISKIASCLLLSEPLPRLVPLRQRRHRYSMDLALFGKQRQPYPP